jgi:hypothetical protein
MTSGGFDPHGSMMPVHDAKAELEMRQQETRGLGRQLITLTLFAAAGIALLVVLSLLF